MKVFQRIDPRAIEFWVTVACQPRVRVVAVHLLHRRDSITRVKWLLDTTSNDSIKLHAQQAVECGAFTEPAEVTDAIRRGFEHITSEEAEQWINGPARSSL